MSGTMDEQELRDDLPWLVNGSLDYRRREALQSVMSSLPAVQDEQRFLQRLRAAMRDEGSGGPGELGWRRLRRQIEAEARAQQPARSSARWRGLAIAASVLMAAQLAWFLAAPPRDAAYEPMAAPPVATAGVILQVRFRPQAQLAQIEPLMQRLDLRVLDGPGASGVWRVQLRSGDPQQVLQVLRTQSALIESAGLD